MKVENIDKYGCDDTTISSKDSVVTAPHTMTDTAVSNMECAIKSIRQNYEEDNTFTNMQKLDNSIKQSMPRMSICPAILQQNELQTSKHHNASNFEHSLRTDNTQSRTPNIERVSNGISESTVNSMASNTAPIIKNLENMLKAGKQVFHIQVKVPGCENSDNKQIQQVIVINPGEDADRAMSQAVSDITKRLNSEAAAKVACGLPPEKETVIEITRIANPTESCQSLEKTAIKSENELPDHQSIGDQARRVVDVLDMAAARSAHKRKSPPLRTRNFTDGPVSNAPTTIHADRLKPPLVVDSQDLFKNPFSPFLSRSYSAQSQQPLQNVNSSPATDMTAAMKLGISRGGAHAHNQTSTSGGFMTRNPRDVCSVLSDLSASSQPSNPVTTIVQSFGAPVRLPAPPVLPPPPQHQRPCVNPRRTAAILNRSRVSVRPPVSVGMQQLSTMTATESKSSPSIITLSDTLSSLESGGDINMLDLDNDFLSGDGNY